MIKEALVGLLVVASLASMSAAQEKSRRVTVMEDANSISFLPHRSRSWRKDTN